ncbi:MAG: HDOD domain-containing protein [Solirubrobacteraceae bacterium]|jgi:EAL and modified HD-GYP domain-containing signal transduction protein
MPNVLVVRQPIFTPRLEVAGYELLCHGGSVADALVAEAEGITATATVVLDSFIEIALERVVGSKTAWVTVAREFVTGVRARPVPRGHIGLELLGDVGVDDELLAGLRRLKRLGYRLALDGSQRAGDAAPLLALADLLRLDLRTVGRDALEEQVARLKAHAVPIVVAGVDTHADHELCAAAGCDLIQGLFFCEPVAPRGGGIAANRLALLNLVGALHDPAIELSDLEYLLAGDLALSLRLLQYINSAFFWLRGEVRSIGQALALLGVAKLRQWAILSVLASIDDKPAELTVLALIRARFCQQAGEQWQLASPGELFMLGLFSVIDALIDASMGEVLAQLPLPADVCDALIHRAGRKGLLLDCVTALESGAFERAQAIVERAGELYCEAVIWAVHAAGALFAQPDGADVEAPETQP